MKITSSRIASKVFQKIRQNKLLFIQTLQTACLMGTGDLIAQAAVEKKKINQIEYQRTAKFASLGLLVGPSVGTWYKFLSKRVVDQSKYTAAIKKVTLDQLIFTPLFIPIFIMTINVINLKSWEHIQNEVKLKYNEILITNFKIWPWIQIINFGFVPLKYQVLVVQSVAVFWNAYLSFKTQSTKKDIKTIN